MSNDNYTVGMYRPEHRGDVLDLLQALWGSDKDVNDRYFAWKYEANPYVSEPLGVVACHQNQTVGFRGYFVSRWQVGDPPQIFDMLNPGDTVVHPEHRRTGLSLSMGRFAGAVLADRYQFFLNTSCSPASLPGYLRLGFRPLAAKTYTAHAGTLGRMRSILTRIGLLSRGRVRGWREPPAPIRVSRTPQVEAMAKLARRDLQRDGKVCLLRDTAFFSWRFLNPKVDNHFWYFQGAQTLQAYLVLSVEQDKQRARLVDWASEDEFSLRMIIRELLRNRPVDRLVIADFCHDSRLSELRGNTLVNRIWQLLKYRRANALPLLLRPVTANPTDEDWAITGIDLRRVENWRLLPIGGDQV